jgi:hypothetical protein
VSSQNTFGALLAHYTCNQAIIAAILAINEKHTLPVKHANIHHTLVWNWVLKNDWRWWSQIMLWGLLRAGGVRGHCVFMDYFIRL